KDALVGARSTLDYALGKREFNSVYIGKDKNYYEKYIYEEKKVDKFIKYVNDIDVKDKYIAICPDKGEVYRDRLPKGAIFSDETKVLNRYKNEIDGKYIDLYTLMMNHKDEYIFYKSDHHWREGAYLAYKELAKTMGLEEMNDIEKVTCNNFRGSLDSKSSYYNSAIDEILFYLPKNYDNIKVKGDDKEINVLDKDEFKNKDKYKALFSGNYGLVEIEGNPDSDKTLLIVKDSFANAVASLFTNEYKTIYMVDKRFFSQKINNFIKENDIDTCLVLGSVNGLN
ncbi:MAG: DHHW family protein, partial [Fenollaria timonensis]